jgi:hypothetical protein
MAARFWTPPEYWYNQPSDGPAEGESRAAWKNRTFAAHYGNPGMFTLAELLEDPDR